jgi:hypothetical protein
LGGSLGGLRSSDLETVQVSLSKLGEQLQVVTTEVSRLAKQRTKENVEHLAQQLNAKARVVEALVDDHRRVNEDLQTINQQLAAGQQDRQTLVQNLDAVVQHVNTAVQSLGQQLQLQLVQVQQHMQQVRLESSSGSNRSGGDGGGPSSAAAAAEAADAAGLARDLLAQLVQTQQSQAQEAAAAVQREARKSAVLYATVLQLGQQMDGMRREVAERLEFLAGSVDQRLGVADDPDPASFRAVSVREASALEQRVQGRIYAAVAETAEVAASERRAGLEALAERQEEERRRVTSVGVEAQKLRIQLQLEAQQRLALEDTHRQWLSQLRDGLIASGEEAGSRIAHTLMRVEETAAANRVEAQMAVDQQREQLLGELERRAGELHHVQDGLAQAVREAEGRLALLIAERQSAAEGNSMRLLQRHETLEQEVRTVTDATTRSLAGLKDTQDRRATRLEQVLEAEVTTRQEEGAATKARLESVVASITRAIDAVQENTADDLREQEERLMQAVTTVNMQVQQGRQQMQRDVDEDLARAAARLARVEDLLTDLEPRAEDAEAETERAVQDAMEGLLVRVELQAAEDRAGALANMVSDLHADLQAERRLRRGLEEKVDALLDRQRRDQRQDDSDWQESVRAATAWLQQAASRADGGSGGDEEDGGVIGQRPPHGKAEPKVRVRGDIFAGE